MSKTPRTGGVAGVLQVWGGPRMPSEAPIDNAQRRQELQRILATNNKPITGSVLAARLGVSRQIVVSDVALLRAQGVAITATPAGYFLQVEPANAKELRRVIASKHGPDPAEIRRELNAIVDQGGFIEDVIVEHPVYGELRGLLMIRSRHDVIQFLQRMAASQGTPLSSLTGGVHLHTITAPDEEILQRIQSALLRLEMVPQ